MLVRHSGQVRLCERTRPSGWSLTNAYKRKALVRLRMAGTGDLRSPGLRSDVRARRRVAEDGRPLRVIWGGHPARA